MVDVLPGVTVNVAAQATPSGVSTATGRLFAVGITERGPVTPTVVTGWSSFQRQFGGRTHYATLPDALRAFWATGGGDVVVGRVVGAGATAASVTLDDGEAVNTLDIEARDPGGHGDDLAVEVVHRDDGTFDLVVTDDGVQVERHSRLADPGDAADRLSGSRYLRGADLGSESADPTPAEGIFELSGGDDDRGSIDDGAWQAALDGFDRDYGPGQVAAPGRESATARDQLISHAEDNNRVAFLDGGQGDSATDLEAAVADLDTRNAALFAPWLQVSMDGRARTVPASVIAAGLTARLDAEAPTGHLAPDVTRAQLDRVDDVDVSFTDDEHAALNAAGVNVFRTVRGQGVLLRGWRTLSSEEPWIQLSQSRYIMGVSARLGAIAERFVFRTLTPPTISDFGNQLKGVLKDDFDAGALYGDEPDDAYTVDTSPDVNPSEEISAGRLHALVSVQVAPYAERIVIDVVKTAIA